MAAKEGYRHTRTKTAHVRARPWMPDAPRKSRQPQPATGLARGGTGTAQRATPYSRAIPQEPEKTDPNLVDKAIQTIVQVGMPTLVVLFLISLAVPITIRVGPLLLFPYRAFLLVMFFPLLYWFLSGRAGKLQSYDWLMMFSVGWACLALAANHPLGRIFETMGIYVAEIFGAYMLGRVAIRNGADFQKLAKTMFWMALILLPFAVGEAVLKRPLALELFPGSISPVFIGERFGLRRTQTLFPHPIHHGVFLSTCLGVAWFAVSYKSGLVLRSIRAFIVMVCTAVSLSSAALFALVFQSIFIAWEFIMGAMRKRWTLFAVLSVLAYIAIDLAATKTPFHVVVNYATFSSGSAYNRILIWNFGTQNVADNPIFGLGLNDWVRPRYMSPSVDNYWLLIAMRYGIPASFAYMAALIIILRRVSLAELINPVDQASRAGYLVSFGGIVMAGATVHYWHAIGSFVVFFFASGIWAIDAGKARQAAPPDDKS